MQAKTLGRRPGLRGTLDGWHGRRAASALVCALGLRPAGHKAGPRRGWPHVCPDRRLPTGRRGQVGKTSSLEPYWKH